MEPPQFVPYPGPFGGSLAKFDELTKAYGACNAAGAAYLGAMLMFFVAIGFGMSFGVGAYYACMALGVLNFLVFAVRAMIVAAPSVGMPVWLGVCLAIFLVLVPCGTIVLLIVIQQLLTNKLKEFGLKPGFTGLSKKKIAAARAVLQSQQAG